MLVVRGTKKLRDRVRGAPAVADDTSTTGLGDWFATALFWRPQVALLVNRRTFLPVFMDLAPAATLLDRVPAAIEAVLVGHDVDAAFLAGERAAMTDVRIAPTDDRSVVGVMNEFSFLGQHRQAIDPVGLVELSVRLAHTPVGPLRARTGFPDAELAAVVARSAPLAPVIPLFPESVPPGAEMAQRGSVYQLKITLRDTTPPIWRRVLVDGAATLGHLHEVIQAAFGWWDYHLHEFEIDGDRYGVPDPEDDWGPPAADEGSVPLESVAGPGSTMEYVYDFGDNWRHKVVVEKVLPPGPRSAVPACTGGRRACPPEDCGGTWGYRELLEILADPTHPEHDESKTWIGRPFDPAAFDPAEFAANLHQQRLLSRDD